MKILITSLLLFGGLNQILARSVPWNIEDPHLTGWWNDYEDDPLYLPSGPHNDLFFKFVVGSDSEELREVTSIDEHDYGRNAFFGNLLGTFFGNSEDDPDSHEKAKINSVEEKAKEDDSEEISTKQDADENNGFEIILAEIFGSQETKSSEEKNADENNENANAAETVDEKSNENSKEKSVVDIFDLADSSEENKVEVESKAKSSEELDLKEDKSAESSQETQAEAEIKDMQQGSEENKESDAAYDLNEKEFLELASFFIDLNLAHDMEIMAHENHENRDEIEKIEEVDAFLETLKVVLDKVMEKSKPPQNRNEDEEVSKTSAEDKECDEEDNSKEGITTTSKPDSKESNEEDNGNEATTTPPKPDSKESDEEDNSNEGITTTLKPDSNESDEEDKEDHNISNEDDLNQISFVFHGIDDADEQQNLNEHKYSVIDLPAEFTATSSPVADKRAVASTSNDQNTINEYLEIRNSLDTQQHFLQKNELNLDTDFYAILSNNYDDGSLNKFEKDIYVVHENLDRIKRNINAMQNLQSKLYFHKLVTAAVEDIQNKPKN